jgi:hypothetical protein
MSSYFDRVEQAMGDAVERRAHRPWYIRVLALRSGRTLAVVFAALVVATPAVGAATNWFGLGAPDRFPAQPGTLGPGRALPATGELLPLRVPDPQGGPPWGLRLVRTTRGDACVQLGRVEDGELGSLGIDGAWNNDHVFHPFPNTSQGADCGPTDAVGHGFLNVVYTGMIASANPTVGVKGPQAGSCQPPLLFVGRMGAAARNRRHRYRLARVRSCPSGSTRIVFMGLLGPDATSISYRAPNGSTDTERTSGSDGAYLLVFRMNAATCLLYTQGPNGGYGPCGGTESIGGVSPDSIGAIKAITYRDGHVCRLEPSLTLTTRLRALRMKLETKLKLRQGKPLTALQHSALRSALLRFLASQRVSLAAYRDQIHPFCPAVRWVPFKTAKVTPAQVATPVHVHEFPVGVYGCPNKLRLPDACSGLSPRPTPAVPVEWSFKARVPVTHDRSWYEWSLQSPGCSPDESFATYSDIHPGQILRYSTFLETNCRGAYHVTVGFMAQPPAGQTSANGGGGVPGEDGSILVGRASFTIH